MPPDGLISLLDTHEHLGELFALHQEAVLTLNWTLAAELLEAYRSLLGLHIQQEEQLLLPLFERGRALERAPAILFTGQHRKMNAMLDRVSSQLAMLQHPAGTRRQAIDLLDLESAFKHLVEHHHGAEELYFYPMLHEVATTDESRELLGRCRDQWDFARAGLRSLIARAQQIITATADHS